MMGGSEGGCTVSVVGQDLNAQFEPERSSCTSPAMSVACSATARKEPILLKHSDFDYETTDTNF